MAEDQEKITDSKFSSTIGAAFIMSLIGLIYQSQFKTDKPIVGKDFVVGGKEYKKDLSKAEINSLVGLSTSELRQKLGKPNFVRLEENSSVTSRSQNTNKDKPDETWHYLDKVKHNSSGTKMGLACDIRDGRCIAAKISGL